jgi:hypothetical protein
LGKSEARRINGNRPLKSAAHPKQQPFLSML